MSRNTLILERIQVGELDTKQYSGENLFIKLGEIQESNAEILEKYPAEKIKKLVVLCRLQVFYFYFKS